MNKDKQKALELLKQKINGEINITFNEIAKQSGYERKQINRFYNQIEKKDIRLKFRGSSNQRILDLPKSLAAKKEADSLQKEFFITGTVPGEVSDLLSLLSIALPVNSVEAINV